DLKTNRPFRIVCHSSSADASDRAAQGVSEKRAERVRSEGANFVRPSGQTGPLAVLRPSAAEVTFTADSAGVAPAHRTAGTRAMLTLEPSRLEQILAGANGLRVVVVGDLMLD